MVVKLLLAHVVNTLVHTNLVRVVEERISVVWPVHSLAIKTSHRWSHRIIIVANLLRSASHLAVLGQEKHIVGRFHHHLRSSCSFKLGLILMDNLAS